MVTVSEVLHSWASEILPASGAEHLTVDVASLGSVRPRFEEVARTEQAGSTLRVVLDDRGVDIDVELRAVPEHRALQVRTSIEAGERGPVTVDEPLEPVRLLWHCESDVLARTVRGGSTEKHYPPEAYTDRTLIRNFEEGIVHGNAVHIGSDTYGRSTGAHVPILQSGTRDGGAVVSMEWSGLWNQQLSFEANEARHVHTARIPVDGMTLKSGERIDLPLTHVVFYDGDTDAGGNQFRRYVNDCIAPPLDGAPVEPPVSYDSWFGIGNEMSEDRLREQIDRCAELGIEYFTVDAGWFPGGFPTGVGNWKADPQKFPNGLEPVAEYVRSQGMKMGLWFDLERAHVDSQVYDEHPEWFITLSEPPELADQPHLSTSVPSREYAHLDLSKNPAREWFVETIGTWIERLDLKWIRYDYNIEPLPYWNERDPSGKFMFKYVDGLYRAFDELRSSHPDLLIENCASGGRRADLGMLRRVHTSWISDSSEVTHVSRYMQSGANRFVPGQYHNNAVPVYSDGELTGSLFSEELVGDDRTRAVDVLSRSLGALSFNGDLESLTSDEIETVERLIDWYKSWRWLLREKFFPLTAPPGRIDQPEVVQFASEDGETALVFGFVAEGRGRLTVSPKGLQDDATYEVRDPFGEASSKRTVEDLSEAGVRVDVGADDPFVRVLEAN